MANVLIAGASRGIGLELVRQYAGAGDTVIAGARDLSAAAQLDEFAASADNVRVVQLDIASPESITAASEAVGDQPLDVVMVVGAVLGAMPQMLDNIDLDAWHAAFDANTIGPMLIARAFKENLAASGDGKLMIVSSQLAASTWPMGGMYIYSTTKAAVNKVVQILALDWRKDPITVVVTHPGYVQTDMGGPNADITAEESASGLRNVMASETKEDSGKFYKWNGDIHPW